MINPIKPSVLEFWESLRAKRAHHTRKDILQTTKNIYLGILGSQDPTPICFKTSLGLSIDPTEMHLLIRKLLLLCKPNLQTWTMQGWWPFVKMGPPVSLYGPNWQIFIDRFFDKGQTWFLVNPTFGSRGISVPILVADIVPLPNV